MKGGDLLMSDEQPASESIASVTTGKNRGGCLTAWLILGMIGSIYSIFLYSSGRALFKSALPAWGMAILLVLSLLILASLYGIWLWKKWGLYGYFGLIILGLIINVMLGLNLLSAIFGAVLSGGIMYILIKPSLDQFD